MTTLPFRAVTIPLHSGSDPDVVGIDDCREAIGEWPDGDWPEIETPCEDPDNPSGQCSYNAVGLEPDRCLYCGKRTG